MKPKEPEALPVSHRQAFSRKASPVEEAFADMQSMLKRIIARLVTNPNDVEDILQDTYVKAVIGEATTTVRNPRAYLVTIARSVALNDLAKQSRQIAESIEAAGGLSVISDEPSPEERLIEDDKLQALRDATATLPPQCRRAFILCKVYGFSYKEIAARMGISVSTVEKHMIAALRRCETYIRKLDAADARSRLPATEPPLRSEG